MPQGRPPGPKKQGVSYRLTPEALQLLSTLAKRYGLNNSDMLEVMIRNQAKSEGLWPPSGADI